MIDWRTVAKVDHSDSSMKPVSQYPQNSQNEKNAGQNANIANIAKAYSQPNPLENRLRELILMADNSKGMTDEQIQAISDEGDLIIKRLPPETVRQVFRE